MVHRTALFLGGVGAAAVLALAMNLGGLFSAAPTAANDPATNQAAAIAPHPTKTVIDKVYVEPTPPQSVVHVNKPPRNRAPAATATRPRGERDRGDRGERGGD